MSEQKLIESKVRENSSASEGKVAWERALIIANWIFVTFRQTPVSVEVRREMLAESRYRGKSIGILTRTSRWPIPN